MAKQTRSQSGAYIYSFTINTALTIVELTAGIASGSAAILADGIQNLSDSLVIAISFVASGSRDQRAAKKPATIDALILMFIALFIGGMAFHKLDNPSNPPSQLLMFIGFLSVVINFAAAAALKSRKRDVITKAPIVGLFFSALSGLIVFGAGVLSYFGVHGHLDAYAGIFIAFLLFYRSLGLLTQARAL